MVNFFGWFLSIFFKICTGPSKESSKAYLSWPLIKVCAYWFWLNRIWQITKVGQTTAVLQLWLAVMFADKLYQYITLLCVFCASWKYVFHIGFEYKKCHMSENMETDDKKIIIWFCIFIYRISLNKVRGH